jgi:hypothetical protein
MQDYTLVKRYRCGSNDAADQNNSGGQKNPYCLIRLIRSRPVVTILEPAWPEPISRILGEKGLRRCRRGWLSRRTSLRFRLALFRCFLQLASRMTFARCQSDTRDEQNKTEFLHVGIECMGG